MSGFGQITVCYKFISKLIWNLTEKYLSDNLKHYKYLYNLLSKIFVYGKHLYTYKKRNTPLKVLGTFLQNVFPAKEWMIRRPINLK